MAVSNADTETHSERIVGKTLLTQLSCLTVGLRRNVVVKSRHDFISYIAKAGNQTSSESGPYNIDMIVIINDIASQDVFSLQTLSDRKPSVKGKAEGEG